MQRILDCLLVMGLTGCKAEPNAEKTLDPAGIADDELVTESSGARSGLQESAATAEKSPVAPQTALDKPALSSVNELKTLGADIKWNDEGAAVGI